MVYVDHLTYYPKSPLGHKVWCHLWADDVVELHLFAKKLHLKRSWFQDRTEFPHYDLTENKRNEALKLGAAQHSMHDWLWERRRLSRLGLTHRESESESE